MVIVINFFLFGLTKITEINIINRNSKKKNLSSATPAIPRLLKHTASNLNKEQLLEIYFTMEYAQIIHKYIFNGTLRV